MTSCAGVRPLKPKRRGPIDADVEKSFEEVEREKILDYYFQLRLKDRENKKSNRRRRNVRIYRPAKPRAAPRVAAPKPRKPKILVNPDENKIRMEQMLSFHCIKKRDANNCQAFTKAIADNCRDEYDLDDQRLIRCIERKLGR
jgi:hypothetical protein